MWIVCKTIGELGPAAVPLSVMAPGDAVTFFGVIPLSVKGRRPVPAGGKNPPGPLAIGG